MSPVMARKVGPFRQVSTTTMDGNDVAAAMLDRIDLPAISMIADFEVRHAQEFLC